MLSYKSKFIPDGKKITFDLAKVISARYFTEKESLYGYEDSDEITSGWMVLLEVNETE